MALDIIFEIAQLLVTLSPLTLFVCGLVAALWLIERMTDVVLSDITKWIKTVGYLGIFFGIFSFVTAIGGLIFIYKNGSQQNFDISTVGILFLVGLVLSLRQVRYIRFGSYISLFGSLIVLSIIYWSYTNDIFIPGLTSILLIAIVSAARIIDDFTYVLGSIFSIPLVSVAIGVIAIIASVLALFNLTFLSLFTLFFSI